MKIKKHVLLLLMTFGVVAFSRNNYLLVNAEEQGNSIFANYLITENSSTFSEKVYVSNEIKPFVEDLGVTIYTETKKTGWWIFATTHYYYYYYTSQNVDKIVSVRSVGNDLDSVVFMVEQLENYATNFINEKNLSTNNSSLVLPYLRCLSNQYKDSGSVFESATGYVFKTICGSLNQDFLKYVNDNEAKKYSNSSDSLIDIKNYFATFINNNDVNSSYGTFNTKYKNMNQKMLITNSGEEIDLIHMFCVADGLEEKPTNDEAHDLQNLVSFVGDLHQACYNAGKTNLEVTNFKNEILANDSYQFSWSDFFADLDGYNIGKSHLRVLDDSTKKNKLSTAMYGYYNLVKTNSRYRYRSFIKNVANQYIEFPIENSVGVFVAEDLKTTGIHGFLFKSSNNCNLKPTDLSHSTNFLDADPRIYIMCHNYNNSFSMPSHSVRKAMVKGFTNYVLEMAGYAKFY